MAGKILSIGNSFSEDAHRWLHKLAKDNGVELETVNLFIGGCGLETHWNNLKENRADYDFQPNGNIGERKISIAEALDLEKWDIITIQQVSQLSGVYESYEPYLSSVISIVRKVQPNAKVYIHQTWAYETDSNHGGFVNYNNNQAEMYRAIEQASEKAAKSINAKLLPSGKIIQILRDTVPEFDYKNKGLSLCRDGFHLSLDYGRFTAAATWLKTITGKEIKTSNFEDFNPVLISKIVDVVNKNI